MRMPSPSSFEMSFSPVTIARHYLHYRHVKLITSWRLSKDRPHGSDLEINRTSWNLHRRWTCHYGWSRRISFS
jgi:hypothetical protein